MVLGNIRDNMKTKCFMNFYIVEHIYVVILLGVGIIYGNTEQNSTLLQINEQ